VGVNTPLFMPPMMITGMSSAQNARAVRRRRSAMGTGGALVSVILRSTTRHATISAAPMIRPGTMPEMNSAEMEVLVVTP
jgi:hypothetical protein